jgi:hypothetical protein
MIKLSGKMAIFVLILPPLIFLLIVLLAVFRGENISRSWPLLFSFMLILIFSWKNQRGGAKDTTTESTQD